MDYPCSGFHENEWPGHINKIAWYLPVSGIDHHQNSFVSGSGTVFEFTSESWKGPDSVRESPYLLKRCLWKNRTWFLSTKCFCRTAFIKPFREPTTSWTWSSVWMEFRQLWGMKTMSRLQPTFIATCAWTSQSLSSADRAKKVGIPNCWFLV